jgi:cytochrome c oxidase subunit 2
MFRYLPEQASEFADSVDWIHHVITDISVFFTVAIVGSMIYFAIRYRRRNGVDHATPMIEGNVFLEVVWTVVPSLICVFVFAYGFIGYRELRQVPENALTINVWGQKWHWEFGYENGKRTIGELVVPVDEPVKMVMTSRDVLHSFFVPSMRVKSDVVPGLYTYVSFTPIRTGTFNIFCTEYCGRLHSRMLATLRVVSRAEYEKWLADDTEARRRATMSPVILGQTLYRERGCANCHSMDGTRLVGPTLLDLFGKEGKLADGSTYVADENYLRRSILQPGAEIVAGYANLMPSYEGQLDDDQIYQLIAFIKALDSENPHPDLAPPVEDPAVSDIAPKELTALERGERYYRQYGCQGCHSLDGAAMVGPTFKGLYMKEGRFEDGTTYVADEDYIRRSIVNPAAEIVEGYPNVMPAFQLPENEMSDLLEYIKSIE